MEGLSLTELEELDQEFKRTSIMNRRLDRIQSKEQPTGSIQGEKEYTADRYFYQITKGTREEKDRDTDFFKLLNKVKNGYVPDALEVSHYSAKQQREIMILIPWNATYSGQSSLIKGKGKHKFVDLNGKPITEKKKKKKIWEF